MINIKKELMECSRKQNLPVNIIYSKASGEFRHAVVYSEKSLKVFEKEYSSIDLTEIKLIEEFYTQKDAVKFCEENFLTME